jgi:hypothetical protein
MKQVAAVATDFIYECIKKEANKKNITISEYLNHVIREHLEKTGYNIEKLLEKEQKKPRYNFTIK